MRLTFWLSKLQEAIATLGAAGKVDDMDLDEAEATDKKAKKSKKKRTAEDAETGQSISFVLMNSSASHSVGCSANQVTLHDVLLLS